MNAFCETDLPGNAVAIGRYKVARLLGKGGMSEVYEAEDPRLGSRHAVKVYAYPKDDAEVRARFEQEGRMLAKLAHPRIVRVTDVGETDDGRPYFVMDLVLNPEGVAQSLGDVPDGSVDETTVGKWYDDIREGLAYIHGRGIVHRDLKLQNVMIGPDGHAVLTDFGIAHVGTADGGTAIVDPVNTIIGIRDGKKAVMGSLGYMAPELEMGCAATPKSDWYALGVLAYRLLTGTWCDARTDLVATLDTFDPVWSRILPKLLHANPEGRECLSFAEEKSADVERREMESEDRLLSEKRRGHIARHAARYLAAAVALLALVLVWSWRSRSALDERLSRPTFSDVFRVPASAVDSQLTNRATQSLSDAWVLTHEIFDDLRVGKITGSKARDAIADFDRRAQQNVLSVFDFNRGVIMMGDAKVLQQMLHVAAEEMRRRYPEK